MPQNRRLAWNLLMVALVVESAVLIWVALQSAIAIFASISQGKTVLLTDEIIILVVLVLAGIWLLGTLWAVLQKREWARSSGLTIQILVIAAAAGILQGIMGESWVGFLLLGSAVVGIVAVLMLVAKKPAS